MRDLEKCVIMTELDAECSKINFKKLSKIGNFETTPFPLILEDIFFPFINRKYIQERLIKKIERKARKEYATIAVIKDLHFSVLTDNKGIGYFSLYRYDPNK